MWRLRNEEMGDGETWGRGERETRREGDEERGRRGERETWGRGDLGKGEL